MACGQQKIQSQQKNAAKQAKQKKTSDQKGSSQEGTHLHMPCLQVTDAWPKTNNEHFESKHPKQPLPEEMKDV